MMQPNMNQWCFCPITAHPRVFVLYRIIILALLLYLSTFIYYTLLLNAHESGFSVLRLIRQRNVVSHYTENCQCLKTYCTTLPLTFAKHRHLRFLP